MPGQLEFDRQVIAAFCKRNRIKRLSLFGSVLTESFGPDSDIDVLVEFEDGSRVTLFDIGGMTNELTEMFGRQVDLRTPEDLSRHFRNDVMARAEQLYAA